MSLHSPDSRMIFALGLCMLFGWMIVILICASPHLFRNYIKKWFKSDEDVAEKIRKAEARLEETLRLAQKPSTFLVDQAAVLSSYRDSFEPKVSIALDLLPEEDEEECRPSTSSVHHADVHPHPLLSI